MGRPCEVCLVMSECSLCGRGHGHVSNFYIVDLENFAIASRRRRKYSLLINVDKTKVTVTSHVVSSLSTVVLAD